MKRIYNKTISILAVCCLMIIVSCTKDELVKGDSDTRSNDFFLFINVPDNIETQTRALSEADNYKIDIATLRILLFKEGKLTQEVVIDNKDSSYNADEQAYKIKINDIERNNDIVDFVIVANHNFPSLSKGTTKEDFYENLTFDTNGKWDTETPRLLPFWGEAQHVQLDENLGTRYSPTKFEVTLLRSLARVDFISSTDQSKNTPKAYTLQIKSISIYNSLDKGTIAPSQVSLDPNGAVTRPTLPSNTKAKQEPLKYEVSTPSEFTSQIFIPEQKLIGKDSREIMTFVVGGQTENSTTTTYYRVDLHIPSGSEYKAIDVLRNHRYIINILGVRGNGASTEEAALKSNAKNIEVDLVTWDEAINEGFIYGDKYLGINSSDLFFKEHHVGQELNINIQTNLDIQELKDNIQFVWQTSGLFEAEVSQATNKLNILVKTLTDNSNNEVISDILELELNNHKFNVNVKQNTTKLAYDILCEETKIHGVYQAKLPLNSSNYISVRIRSRENLSGHRYEIVSDKIDNLEFKGEGVLAMTKQSDDFYYQTVKLIGDGTATTTTPKFFTVTPNSQNYQNCSVELKMAYTKKSIVGIGHLEYGYSTDRGNKIEVPHSYRFRESQNNFGLTEKSTIKSERLTNFIHIDDANYKEDLQKLRSAINKNPDILIWGYTGQDKSDDTKEMNSIAVEYLKKGGTMIFMSETIDAIDDFFKKLYSGSGLDISVKAHKSGGAGTNYAFITQPGDVVSDGPFGSVHGKFWGEDASDTRTVTGIPSEDMVVYSLGIPYGKEKTTPDKGVCIFRHTKYNLFFIGDAGFISQAGRSATIKVHTYCPFLVDGEDRPIPKDGYGPGSSTRTGLVHNAVFFANVLAWAVDRAEFHGINSVK